MVVNAPPLQPPRPTTINNAWFRCSDELQRMNGVRCCGLSAMHYIPHSLTHSLQWLPPVLLFHSSFLALPFPSIGQQASLHWNAGILFAMQRCRRWKSLRIASSSTSLPLTLLRLNWNTFRDKLLSFNLIRSSIVRSDHQTIKQTNKQTNRRHCAFDRFLPDFLSAVVWCEKKGGDEWWEAVLSLSLHFFFVYLRKSCNKKQSKISMNLWSWEGN